MWRLPPLRTLLGSAALSNVFLSAFSALQLVFLVRVVGLSSGAVGGLLGFAGAGGVLGALLARRISSVAGTTQTMWLAIVISSPFGLLIPLTATGPRLAYFAGGVLVLMIGVVVFNVTMMSYRQALCPPELLGRVTATMRVAVIGAMPLGGLLGGALGQVLGVRAALWIIMAANLLPAAWLVPTFLHTRTELPEAVAVGQHDR